MTATDTGQPPAGPALISRTRHSVAIQAIKAFWRFVVYLTLILGAVLVSVPLVWTVSSSLKERSQIFIFPPEFIPNPVRWANYADAVSQMHFAMATRNTLVIAVFATIGTLLTSSMAGFAFAHLRFPGRDLIFLVLLATMMLPGTVLLIPTFVLFVKIGWLDTYLPLIVPAWFGGGIFNIFLVRQFMLRLHREVTDAARVDGCGYIDIYWRMALPLVAPVMVTIAAFSLTGTWNDFFGPFIYLSDSGKWTVAIQLQRFVSKTETDWSLLMAGTVLLSIPPLLMFFFLQRYFIQGLVISGVKG